ncbi:MAG TPA: hypothetical protein VG077_05625 [Verrucomicrobiae bacterium]|nr:hypothetical protein [Verrucomicrobiae bacterium]
MKKIICLGVGLLALNFTAVFGQTTNTIDNATGQPIVQSKPELTKFNLDFPGGTPAELVKAIEKAVGRPINVIVPDEAATVKLPPVKLAGINLNELFPAMERAGHAVFGNGISAQEFGFMKSTDNGDDSIWIFYAQRRNTPERVCSFYSLVPYLDRGFTVDDITTAIQTGWKMSGIASPPVLNYHKETKLLIAYGVPDQLSIIQSVLSTLGTYESQYQINNMIERTDRMNSQIKQLQDQVVQLNKKISPLPSPVNLHEEKSGK